MPDLELLERPTEQATEPLQHVYCTRCNEGRETAISLCHAAQKPTAALVLITGDEDHLCVVCDDLWNSRTHQCTLSPTSN